MIEVYRPGRSPIHRLPAAPKLLALVVVGTVLIAIRTPWVAGLALAAVLIAYGIAGLGWRAPVRQLRPLALLLVITLGLHLVITGWWTAVTVVSAIVVLVLLAGLISLTTRTTALVAVVERAAAPLRRFGVSPERLGLVVALGIRCVPVVVGLAAQIRDGQRARAARLPVQGFAVALVVRCLRQADSLAEALTARGLDD